MFEKRFNKEIALRLQYTAPTAEDAKKRLCDTCNLCSKQAYCEERLCPIYRAYETRLAILEAQAHVTVKVSVIHKPRRKYKKPTPAVKVKKQVLSYLTRCYNTTTKRSLKLVIDNASVYAELEAYEDCYHALKKGGLNLVAHHVKEIIAKTKEAN